MTDMIMDGIVTDNFIKQGLIEIFGIQAVENEEVFRVSSGISEPDVIRGLAQRSGRAGFYYWMRLNAEGLGWRCMDFRLLPAPLRITRALQEATDWFTKAGICRAEVKSCDSGWVVRVTGLTAEHAKLDCNFFTGFMQELISWAGGGKFHPARETQCVGNGAEHCEFIFDRQPAL